ncbi:VacJ family lipoprotein [Roseomonas sp. CECT 9278]|uniref:MlaA family lipoprotein n=1 Tax=Roseomonas sp. CECT 9278 TaxID=2845823 RepID=UPI001E2AD7D9|nr:VacJ family lipoprotein [Roseomonas sp. CECT 9278]CAH0291195.1 Intermembrane phospholipid transport system lipoprotein MlaA [Roseomonas sp. CECT 9278]
MPRSTGLLLLVALGVALAAAPAQAAPDPLEPVNRRIHALNRLLQAHVLGPVAEAYVDYTPPGVREGVANAFANLGEPITAISAIAAGDLGRAANAALRFGINTTLGLGGVSDAAAPLGFVRRPMAPADVLCGWGVGSGPYLVLPLIGPSTLRDASAMVATGAALSQAIGPDIVLGWRAGDLFTTYAGFHAELQQIDAQALDSYALHRSAFLQRRAATCTVDRRAALDEDDAAAGEVAAAD